MLFIIDGYNLLFHEDWHAAGNTLEGQRDHLLKELARYRTRHANTKIVVVFDGRMRIGPGEQMSCVHGIEVIYATDEGRADEMVVHLSRQCPGSRVVTADRKVAQKARASQAIVINPSDFLRDWRRSARHDSNDEKNSPPKSDGEIQEWLDYFGLDAEVPIPPAPQPPKRGTQRGKH